VSFDEPEARPPVLEGISTMAVETKAVTPAVLVTDPPQVSAIPELPHEPAPPPTSETTPSVRAPRTPSQRPKAFAIGDRVWPVRLWKDIPIITCTYLAEARPKEYQRALDAEEFQSRKFRLVCRKPDMRVAAQVPHGYVEVNLSAEHCVGLAKRLVAYCGLDAATVTVEAG
jgi:hypothetical protein